MPDGVKFSVFTKPWPKKSVEELGAFAHWLGFDGIELPVRPGFPVNPGNMAEELPKAAKTLEGYNLRIYSVAGTADEATVAACASAGVPTLRVMAPVGPGGYLETERTLRADFERLLPLLERHRVRIGVQNHSGKYVCNAAGLRALLNGFDLARVGAIWDAAHNALQGEEPEIALEIVWPHLCMVNLKNATWQRRSAADQPAEWTPHWCGGREGLASWTRVSQELKRRKYNGVVCLTAEYSDEAQVDKLIAEDLHFARSLFSGPQAQSGR